MDLILSLEVQSVELYKSLEFCAEAVWHTITHDDLFSPLVHFKIRSRQVDAVVIGSVVNNGHHLPHLAGSAADMGMVMEEVEVCHVRYAAAKAMFGADVVMRGYLLEIIAILIAEGGDKKGHEPIQAGFREEGADRGGAVREGEVELLVFGPFLINVDVQ